MKGTQTEKEEVKPSLFSAGVGVNFLLYTNVRLREK